METNVIFFALEKKISIKVAIVLFLLAGNFPAYSQGEYEKVLKHSTKTFEAEMAELKVEAENAPKQIEHYLIRHEIYQIAICLLLVIIIVQITQLPYRLGLKRKFYAPSDAYAVNALSIVPNVHARAGHSKC